MGIAIRFTCIICEIIALDPTGWQLSEEMDRKRDLRFGICPDPDCRAEAVRGPGRRAAHQRSFDTDHVVGGALGAEERRIWEDGHEARSPGLTKQQMMHLLREARRAAGCCIYCGQPKPQKPAMGRRSGVRALEGTS